MSYIEDENLIIDIDYSLVLDEEEAEKLKEIEQRFIESYAQNKDKMSIDEWLFFEIKKISQLNQIMILVKLAMKL